MVGAYLEFASAGGVMAPLYMSGPSICVVSPRPQQFTAFPELGKQGQRQKVTRPSSFCWGTLEPAATQLCLAPALPGLRSSLPRTLGWHQQAGPPGRLCVGPVRRLELPTTYFSGQEEPLRGLSFGARIIKIKTARTPGRPGPGNQKPHRGAADSLERKWGGSRR